MIEDLLSHKLSRAQETLLRKSIQGITTAAIVFVSPFVIYDFFRGEFFLGAIGTFMLLVVAYAAWNTLAGRLSYKVTFVFLTPAFLAFSWVSIPDLGVIGALWSYPTIIIFYFIFPERLARFANIAILVVVLPLTLIEIETEVALRLCATLIGVSILCATFVRRLNSQQIELEDMASRDTLTMLSNRMNMDSVLDDAIEFNQSRGYPLSLLSIDLDQFRQVNSNCGYEKGDQVLQAFGRLLVDITFSSDEIFRMGGEEFLILLKGSDRQAAMQQAAKIQAALKQTHLVESGRLTLSIGVATLKIGDTRYDLLNRADEKLHLAKESGGNCIKS